MLETFYLACRAEGGTADEIHLRGLKAVLALSQPEPVTPTLAHEAYVAFVQICKGSSDDAGTYEADEELVRRALKRLDDLEQHHPTLTPIPVSERPWEHEGWCDAEGFAWFWSPEDQCWFWERHDSNFIMRYGEEFSCLPFHALPLPAAPGEGE
jgi:hypothetical protein